MVRACIICQDRTEGILTQSRKGKEKNMSYRMISTARRGVGDRVNEAYKNCHSWDEKLWRNL